MLLSHHTTVTSLERHCIANHRKFDCFFICFFVLTIDTSTLLLLCEWIHRWTEDWFFNWSAMRFPCHNVIMIILDSDIYIYHIPKFIHVFLALLFFCAQMKFDLVHIWWFWGRKQLSCTGTSNYIPQILCDVIIHPFHIYLLQAPKSSYVLYGFFNASWAMIQSPNKTMRLPKAIIRLPHCYWS